MPRIRARRYLLMSRTGPGEAQLLLQPSPGGWTFPFVELERHSYAFVAPLADAVRSSYGVDIALLRNVYRHAAAPGEYADRVLAVEVTCPHWAPPPGSRWVTEADLDALDLAVSEHRDVLASWFDEAAGRAAVPANRSPWASPGWLPDVVGWIDDQLRHRAIRRTGPVEQVKCGSVSCLLKLATDAGTLWFKAVPAFFPTEVGVTAALAVEFPERVPQLVAVDRKRRWMLMDSFAGGLLEDEPDTGRWAEVLRAYAQMQVRLTDRVDSLLVAGCHDRRPPVMFAQFEQLLADDAFLGAVLRPEEVMRLRALLPELKALAEQLEAIGIPYTLEHGDLQCRNISGDLRIFDWSDACVAHPFFSLWYFLGCVPGTPGEQSILLKERLTAAYLAPWTQYASHDMLRTGVEASARLANLHYALSYYSYIAPLSEENWADVIADYLRALVG